MVEGDICTGGTEVVVGVVGILLKGTGGAEVGEIGNTIW